MVQANGEEKHPAPLWGGIVLLDPSGLSKTWVGEINKQNNLGAKVKPRDDTTSWCRQKRGGGGEFVCRFFGFMIKYSYVFT